MTEIGRAAEAIRGSGSLALACHVGPDGDALGSMLALGLAARAAGKDVVAGFGTPFVVPATLRFLRGQDLLVPPSGFPAAPETMVVFDAGSADRIGELAESAGQASTLIVIDHHVTNDGFGDIVVIDHRAAATAELVHRILDSLGWEVTPDVATCLHAAVVTDTGRFSYSNTRPETLRLGADLVEAGASTVEISQHVYEEAPFGYLKAAAAALARAKLDEELGMVSAVITQADLNDAGVDWGDMDGLIDTLRLAREADVAVLAKVHDDGRVKLSFRSRGATDVGSLAADMGGGGHKLAAGVTVEGAVDEILDTVRERIGRYR